MNRIIKFRVWDSENEKWFDDRKRCCHISYTTENFGISKRFIFQQFTGLKDKNGKEIYEGDILSIPDGDDEDYSNAIIEVIYYSSCFCYREIGKKKIESIQSHIGFTIQDTDAEIIGNILENPELCK